MIVFEGSPGAGKSSRLGALLAAHPDALLFPEAQPTPGAAHPADLHGLLQEDEQRIHHANRAGTARCDVLVASDRCHIGVLAYRYALATTGAAPPQVFHQAIDLARLLDLDNRHQHDEVQVTILAPDHSRARRAAYAHDPRYRPWFDPTFLTAYNQFLVNLDRWVTPGPRWRTESAIPTAHPTWPAAEAVALRCEHGCGSARSPVISTGRAHIQLYPGALHQRSEDTGEVQCLRTADEIAAAWHARQQAVPTTAPHTPTLQPGKRTRR